jgi:hypothetical protein
MNNQYGHLQSEVDAVITQLKNTQYSRAMFLIRSLFNSLTKEAEERQRLEVDLVEQRDYIDKIMTKLVSIESMCKNFKEEMEKPVNVK